MQSKNLIYNVTIYRYHKVNSISITLNAFATKMYKHILCKISFYNFVNIVDLLLFLYTECSLKCINVKEYFKVCTFRNDIKNTITEIFLFISVIKFFHSIIMLINIFVSKVTAFSKRQQWRNYIFIIDVVSTIQDDWIISLII